VGVRGGNHVAEFVSALKQQAPAAVQIMFFLSERLINSENGLHNTHDLLSLFFLFSFPSFFF